MTYTLRICAALLFGAVLAQPSMAAEQVGKVMSAKTSVFSSGETGRRTLDSNDPIFFMDRLTTNGTGVGEFQFSDGTKLAIGPSASVTVDQFVAKRQNRFEKFGIAATKGTFRWISGRSPSAAYSIKTPLGTMANRGTAYDVTNRGGKTYVVLLNGGATFCVSKRCKRLSRSGDFITIDRSGISDVGDVRNAFSNRREAAQIFPFLANPGMLSSSFRVRGSNLLTRAGFGKQGGSPNNSTTPASNTNNSVAPSNTDGGGGGGGGGGGDGGGGGRDRDRDNSRDRDSNGGCRGNCGKGGSGGEEGGDGED